MKAEEWLRMTLVVKIRNKLAAWSRDDFVAFATQEFGAPELTKQQVGELCEKLKVKGVEKPGKQFYPKRELEDNTVRVEFKMVDNPGHTDWPETHWYLAGSRAEIRHAGVESVVKWALERIVDEPRGLWADQARRWRQSNKLERFDLEKAGDLPMTEDLRKVVDRRLRKAATMRTPLPDNTTIAKQYWGLQAGDRLVSEQVQSEIEVVEVRANLDTPPTITFQKVSP